MSIPRLSQKETVERRPAPRPGAAYAADAVLYVPLSGPIAGAEAIRRYEEGIEAAFPGHTIIVLRYVKEDRARAVEWEFRGRNDGPICLPQGVVSPTHRQVTLRGASIVSLTPRGLVVEEHRYYDVCRLLEQLGR
jgi:hypothetical protein